MSRLPTIRRSYHNTTGLNVIDHQDSGKGKVVDKPSVLSLRNDYTTKPYQRKTELQSRLTPQVLLELHKDGSSEYITLTVRGLYDRVMKAITSRTTATNVYNNASSTVSPSTVNKENQPDVRWANVEASPSSRVIIGSSNTTLPVPPNVELPPSSDFQQQQQLHYRQRLGGYLHPRDMRRLITPFSSSNEPELIVRRHVILLNFDPLRAIALRDRLLVLVPQGADSILLELENQVRGRNANQHGVSVDDLLFLPSIPSVSNDSSPLNTYYNDDYGSENNTNKASKKGPNTKKFKGKEQKLKEIQEVDGSERDDQDEVTTISSHTATGTTTTTNISEDDNFIQKNTDNNIDTTNIEDVTDTGNFDDEWKDFEGMSWIDLPFELQAVDAVLSSVVKMLFDDATTLTNRGLSLLQLDHHNNSNNHQNNNQLQEKLRYLKDEVKEMESRVQGFIRAMNLVLDEDEDMALMNLSRLLSNPERFIQPVSQQILEEESDEPELILEAHLQQALGVVNALHLLQGKIVTTEELVSLQMDTVRNRLLYINTLVSVISLCVGIGSFVGSIFGMNLINHIETAPNAFVQIVVGTILGCIFILVGLLYTLHMAGAMPAAITTSKSI